MGRRDVDDDDDGDDDGFGLLIIIIICSGLGHDDDGELNGGLTGTWKSVRSTGIGIRYIGSYITPVYVGKRQKSSSSKQNSSAVCAFLLLTCMRKKSKGNLGTSHGRRFEACSLSEEIQLSSPTYCTVLYLYLSSHL